MEDRGSKRRGEGLKRLRKAAGLSRVELAERARLSVDTVESLELGRRCVLRMELALAERLADALRFRNARAMVQAIEEA